MKTRTITIDVHDAEIEGNVGSIENPLMLSLKEYRNGGTYKKVRIPMTPHMVTYIADQLWIAHAKYQKTATDIKCNILNNHNIINENTVS